MLFFFNPLVEQLVFYFVKTSARKPFPALFVGMDSCRDTPQAQAQRHCRLGLYFGCGGPGNAWSVCTVETSPSFLIDLFFFSPPVSPCRSCLLPFYCKAIWNAWSLCSSPSSPCTWVPWSGSVSSVWVITATFTTTSQTPVGWTWGSVSPFTDGT